MKKTICKYAKITAAIVMGVVLNHAHLAMAGWTGVMNGTGIGSASVNVKSSELKSSTATTTNNMQNPSVAMVKTNGYTFGKPLPEGASIYTVAKVKGFPGYIWQADTVGSNGDSTDNAELENRVTITAADCASLEMESSSPDLAADAKSGTITVKAKATAGTALWLRGIEYMGDPTDLPPDLEATEDINETTEFLKTNGALKWDILLVGPFDLMTAACDSIKIPFTIDTDPSHLYFVSDGVAKSLPLVIKCPNDIVIDDCQTKVKYPETVIVGGCGDIVVTFDPPTPTGGWDAGAFPVGSTPVTVTATDKDGNKKSCVFNVIVKDTTAPVIPPLATLTGEASVTVPQPPDFLDNCGGTVKGKTTDPLVYNQQGTFTVHWTYTDGSGNSSTADQTVIVDDVTPPTAPTIADALGQCSVTVTAPTATDAVAGTIIGTTTDPKTYNTQGKFTVRWTFDDGNGNTSTANQTVIVKDTIPPVITGCPANILLQTGSAETTCGMAATWTPPTASDNCTLASLTSTHEPGTTFPVGTTTVTYTATDGVGQATTCSFTVKVEDKTPPQTPTLPSLTFDSCSGTPATPPTPTTTDYCAGTVTGTTTTAFPITAQGTTVVTWTFNDGKGNSTTANQNVTVKGLTFTGFYSPIGTVSNTCAAGSAVVINRGSVAPFKFDMFCGTTKITGGTAPTVTIEKVSTGSTGTCAPISGTAETFIAEYQNDWHYNWDTNGKDRTTYKVTVNLPDGITKPYVFIRIK